MPRLRLRESCVSSSRHELNIKGVPAMGMSRDTLAKDHKSFGGSKPAMGMSRDTLANDHQSFGGSQPAMGMSRDTLANDHKSFGGS
ncbi:hypothetical protein DPMN_140755 [Dreissena polymorpha]|uniref:Uncharacterized protein n=1 Tax=Dreissena polymorpha TaxID=45954 RepID=A0A9D4G867_DREPO|nr:hypothetical protein DPMN_140755 [Dreissena polymorpha]